MKYVYSQRSFTQNCQAEIFSLHSTLATAAVVAVTVTRLKTVPTQWPIKYAVPKGQGAIDDHNDIILPVASLPLSLYKM